MGQLQHLPNAAFSQKKALQRLKNNDGDDE